MNFTAYIDAKDAQRDKHYCPCCKDRYDEDEMDMTGEFADLAAVKARYGAPICWPCAEDHVMTADGVLMPREDAIHSEELDAWYSSVDALTEAEIETAAEYADRRMYAGWR